MLDCIWSFLYALHLFILDAGILIRVQQVRLMMFSLNMVDYPMTFLLLSTCNFIFLTSRGYYSKVFLYFEFFCGTPPSCLKGIGWGGARVYVVEPESMWGARVYVEEPESMWWPMRFGPLVVGFRVWG